MNTSNKTFLNSLFWVIAGAVFATGAVIYTHWIDRDAETTNLAYQEVPLTIEQR